MKYKVRALLLVPALWTFSGCHSQFASRTPDEELSAQKVSIASALESDRAGVIFAQRTLELAEQQGGGVHASTGGIPAKRIARANADLYVAQAMLKITQERQQAFSDYMEWKSFAKTPIMTDAAHDPE